MPQASPVPYRMSTVESDHPSSIRGVPCQRIAQPVGSFYGHLGLEHDELDAMSDRVDERRLAMNGEQGIGPGITVKYLS